MIAFIGYKIYQEVSYALWSRIDRRALLPAGVRMGDRLGGTTAIPLLEESLRLSPELDFCGEAVPLADSARTGTHGKRAFVIPLGPRPGHPVAKAVTRYFPYIERILAEAGLPDDLKYIALAESALRPHAGSPKGAIGFWQFLPETGRRYGLIVNDNIDQRRNLAASTKAAAIIMLNFIENLVPGVWLRRPLTWARRAAAEIMVQGIRDFYRLYLPLETQRTFFVFCQPS